MHHQPKFFRYVRSFATVPEVSDLVHWARKEWQLYESERGSVADFSDPFLHSLEEGFLQGKGGFSGTFAFTGTDIIHQVLYTQLEDVRLQSVPNLVYELRERVIGLWPGLRDHMEANSYLQLFAIGEGGEVRFHLDPAPPGFVNVRANLYLVTSDDDKLYMDRHAQPLEDRALLCWEPSLQPHRTDKTTRDRYMLAFGFLLPYASMGWDPNCKRIKTSRRLWAKFVEKSACSTESGSTTARHTLADA